MLIDIVDDGSASGDPRNGRSRPPKGAGEAAAAARQAAPVGPRPDGLVADPAEVTRRLAKPMAPRRSSPRPDVPLGTKLVRQEAESSFVVRMPALAPGETPSEWSSGTVSTDVITAWDTDEPPPTAARLRLALAGRVLSAVMMVAAAVSMLGLVVGPHLFGYQTQTMLTGSMRPKISPGDVVVETKIPADEINIGDVISYHIPLEDRRVVTHRVVQVVKSRDGSVSIRTKGDANNAVDPWLARIDGSTAWKVRVTLPFVGTGIRALRTPAVAATLRYVLPAGLAIWACVLIWSRPSRNPKKDEPVTRAGVAPPRSELEADAPSRPRSSPRSGAVAPVVPVEPAAGAVAFAPGRSTGAAYPTPVPGLLMRRAVVAALVVVALLVVQPLAAWAAFNRTATASTAVASATLQPASGITLTKSCGIVVFDPADLLVSWTVTPSTFATGYSVTLVANGTPGTPRVVAGRTTTSTSFQLTRGVTYTATVRVTFKSWTSTLATTASTAVCGII